MKIHHFVFDYGQDLKDNLEIQDKELTHQITRVLNLSGGEKIILGNGQGEELDCVIETVGKLVKVKILTRRKVKDCFSLTLYMAIVKRDNWEWIVQKAVEIGATKIVPLITEHTVKTNLNYARLNKIVKEATEQSGRAWLMKIEEAISFKDSLEKGGQGENSYFLDQEGLKIEKLGKRGGGEVSLWIGPEGGWSEKERESARLKGFKALSLGPTTLRAETAAVAGTYLFSQFEPHG